MRVFAAFLATFLGVSGAFAQAPEATPSPNPIAAKPIAAKPKAKTPAKPAADDTVTTGIAPTTAPETAKQSVRDSYGAFSLAERMSLQSDLVWTGDYNGLVNGEFSDRLYAAVKAFQRRIKAKDTGVLNPQERAQLTAAARPKQHEVGWQYKEDPVTGARVGLPGKLATVTTPGATGTRWSSQQGQLQIETFRLVGTTMEAAFERQKREPVGRRAGYSVMKPDFFVISGTQGLKKFYVRAAAKDKEVHGLTILYDQAMEGTMDPVVVAMSSAFAPFGNGGSVMPDGSVVRRKVEYGTGVVVSNAGHILSDRQAVEGCKVIVIPGFGNAERIGDGTTGELALLRLYGARNLTPIGLIGTAPGDGTSAVGVADPQAQGGGDAISTQRLDAAPALGFSGAAALDAQGRFAGVAVLKPSVVAGPAGAPQITVIPREQVINFLDANYVTPTSGGAGVEAAKASVVRVICVRK